nr:MAG TPA: Macoilin family [Caudoviricetes sp.]
MNELDYVNALDDLQVKYNDLEQEHEELLAQFNASEKYTAHLEERIGELLEEKDRLEERLKQVVEDSELCRDRNRDLEAEMHILKVALYKCFGVADVM